MAFVMDHRYSSSGSDQSYHSATAEEDHWVHSKNIGAGGFGVVKLFVNQATRELIVLKECRLMNLSRETLERWYGEVEILKRLDHPNIVKAQNVPEGLNCSPISNTPFICMEYCDGGDLRQILRDPENCCGLPEKTIRQICHDVNRGICFLHSQRVIHRDLKPENILIKKIDTNKVDFWSFGMVVFEYVTGKRPFIHGDPVVAIGWVDWVSRKGPKDIHIFWGEDV